MGRRRKPIWLNEAERRQLRQIETSHASGRVRVRAKIVLRVEGAGIQGDPLDEDIARDLGVNRQTVGYWRREFAAGGVERLTKDAPRPGRPRKLIQDSQRLIIETAKAELGSKGKPSSSRALAKLLQDKGISVSHTSVNQIVRRAAIKPARSNEL